MICTDPDPDLDTNPSNNKKKCKKTLISTIFYFFLTSGSESGSVGEWYGSAHPEPDPYQNVTDPNIGLSNWYYFQVTLKSNLL